MADDSPRPDRLQPLSSEEVSALKAACLELRGEGRGAAASWSSNLLLCALLTIEAREAELLALQWRPIQTAPEEGSFLVAKREPQAGTLAVRQLDLPPACPGDLRDQRLQEAEAWAPLPSPPRAQPLLMAD